MIRQYPMTLAPVPNLGIPARKVIITEARLAGTNVWMLIHMEHVA